MYPDFKELLSAFNAHQVRYLTVGGYAVSFHAQPRATKNIDILIDPSEENAKAVLAALVDFGAPVVGLAPEDFAEPGSFYRMGAPPTMVDILPKITGVDFAAAWDRRISSEIEAGLVVSFISRDDLFAAKLAAGRPEDLADVAALKKAQDAGK